MGDTTVKQSVAGLDKKAKEDLLKDVNDQRAKSTPALAALTQTQFDALAKGVSAQYGGVKFTDFKPEEILAATKYLIDLEARGIKPTNFPANFKTFAEFEAEAKKLYEANKEKAPVIPQFTPKKKEETPIVDPTNTRNNNSNSNSPLGNLDPETIKMIFKMIKGFIKGLTTGDWSEMEDSTNGNTNDKPNTPSAKLDMLFEQITPKVTELVTKIAGKAASGTYTPKTFAEDFSAGIKEIIAPLGNTLTAAGLKLEDVNKILDKFPEQIGKIVMDGKPISEFSAAEIKNLFSNPLKILELTRKISEEAKTNFLPQAKVDAKVNLKTDDKPEPRSATYNYDTTLVGGVDKLKDKSVYKMDFDLGAGTITIAQFAEKYPNVKIIKDQQGAIIGLRLESNNDVNDGVELYGVDSKEIRDELTRMDNDIKAAAAAASNNNRIPQQQNIPVPGQ